MSKDLVERWERQINTKYKDLSEQEKDSEYPMFHCGCSSSLFNNDRAIILNNKNWPKN